MRNRSEYLLAIETAVSGGSIALFRGDNYLDGRDGNVARSENLLSSIAELLSFHNVDRGSLQALAVSLGPGSYTGIRIGISTVLGLENALSIKCTGVSVLSAMNALAGWESPSSCAVGMGRAGLCLQEFSAAGASLSEPAVTDQATLIRVIKLGGKRVVVDSSLYQNVMAEMPDISSASLIDAGTDLARLIGMAAIAGLGSADLKPIFVPSRR